MAKKDIAAKVLEKNNDVFADILNVAFFKKDYVKPEELSEAPTEFYYWTQDKEGCRDLRRDVAKDFKQKRETSCNNLHRKPVLH